MNIPQPPSGCQYIVGTGGGCGAIVGRFNNAVCVRQPVTTSISLSKCCGDCDPDEKLAPANWSTRAAAPVVKRDCDTFTQYVPNPLLPPIPPGLTVRTPHNLNNTH
jgi:hypothetical protein